MDWSIYLQALIPVGILMVLAWLVSVARKDVSIVEQSEWEYMGDTLRPFHYSYRRFGDIDPKEVVVAFDWSTGIADVTAKNGTWRLPTPIGTLDDANYVLAMLLDLGTGKDELTYTVADGGLLKTYRLERIGEETLETSLGTMNTVKIRRIRKNNRTIEEITNSIVEDKEQFVISFEWP